MTSKAELESRVIVGFEIHVQLATRSKLFCGCEVTFGARPNSRVCPVCLGLPGSLPVMNRQAFEFAVLAGMALGCTIATRSKWDRKSYFYPDQPKNYQISQYDLPLASDGSFEIPTDRDTKRVGIIRTHLEEDAGKNVHHVGDCSLVDLNRAGTPLLEIVTAPDIGSPQEAYLLCTELQRLVTYLGVSHGIMQRGQMRFEPNVNVAISSDRNEYRTPICEVKNLNSFRAVRAAIEYEHRRQVQGWLADPGYLQRQRPNENRGWDDRRQVTVFQRAKEEAHDYRYFPEPDLMPVELSEKQLAQIRDRLPELPLARRMRLANQHGLSSAQAAWIVSDRATADLFEEALSAGGSAGILARQLANVWSRLANDRGRSVAALGVDAGRIGELAKLLDSARISAAAANRIAERMLDRPDSPQALARSMGLLTVVDGEQLEAWIEEALARNPQAVRDALSNPRKAQAATGFLRGQVMKLSRGKADPRSAGAMIEARLAQLRVQGGAST